MEARADFSEVTILVADLSKAASEVRELASQAVRKTAFDIQRDARQMVPVDTGYLKNSITVDFKGSNKGLVKAEVGPTAEYGLYVEYGTSRMAPQPYLNPATDRHVPSLQLAFLQLGEQVIRR